MFQAADRRARVRLASSHRVSDNFQRPLQIAKTGRPSRCAFSHGVDGTDIDRFTGSVPLTLVLGMRTHISRLQQWFHRLNYDRRQYFDEDLEPELWDLLQTSSLLEIKEFDVFTLAYKEWFGHVPQPHVSEAHFANYMFNQQIPVWVRRYTRKVIELHERGALNPRELGVYRPLPSKKLKRIGKIYTVVLLAVLLYLTFLAYRDTPFFQSLMPATNTEWRVGPSNHTAP